MLNDSLSGTYCGSSELLGSSRGNISVATNHVEFHAVRANGLRLGCLGRGAHAL